MTAPHIVDPAGLLGEALAEASPDLMRHLAEGRDPGDLTTIDDPNTLEQIKGALS